MTARNQDQPLLEIILRELDAALVVCDRQGRIRFCNPAAQSLFRHHPGLAVGGSLYEVCNRGPIAHALGILGQSDPDRPGVGREAPETGLVCATLDNTILLHCRIRTLTSPGAAPPLLLFTFADLTRQLADQGKTARVLPTLIEELRQPLSNLAAAAANLKGHPEMSPESRDEFAGIIYRESTALTDRFESLVWEERAANRQPWPLTDINSADLLDCLVQRLAGEGTVVTMTGAPLWLRADSYSLLLVLEILGRFIREIRRVTEIDLEVLLGDRRVYFDLVWPGAPIPQAALDRLLKSPLPEGGDGVTVAEVLWRHDSELWSQEHQRPGFALLRLPLPHSPRQWQGAAAPVVTALAERPLAALDYVVFDIETTGLNPADGDEILALAAVRIGNGRILSGKRFERQVKPRQPIPAAATSLLAITGNNGGRAAPITKVLPQFHAFVGAAVMVAHNGLFDLNFFRSQEEGGGLRFANPLLDTMLLARLVDAQRTDLTLAGLAEWLGLEGTESQTTMDTCLLTARVFLRLQARLAERGLTTMGQVLTASARLLEGQVTADSGSRDA